MGRLFEQLPLFVLVRICNLVGPSIALLTAQAGDGLAPLHHRVDLVTISSVFSNKEEFLQKLQCLLPLCSYWTRTSWTTILACINGHPAG